MANPTIIPVAIANGALVSDVYNLLGRWISRIEVPAVMTSTTIKFMISMDGSNFFESKDKTNTAHTITIPTTGGGSFTIPIEMTRGAKSYYLKLSTAEDAARTLQVATEPAV